MPKKISIITKKGDQGKTQLFSGEQVSKSSLRLEAYGDVDEMVSLLGCARSCVKKRSLKKTILDLQKDLFIVASELSTTKKNLNNLKQRVDHRMLTKLEKQCDQLGNKVSIPKDFIVPGECLPSSFLDLARAVSRRCERKIVRLVEKKEVNNSFIIPWINRLSDYLYLMARFEENKSRLLKE